MLDESFEEARRRGYSFIAHNIAYNDAWHRLHTMTPGIADRIDRLRSEPGPAAITDMIGHRDELGATLERQSLPPHSRPSRVRSGFP